MPGFFKTLIVVFGVSLVGLPPASGQPFLREGDAGDERQTDPDDEDLERRALARHKAELEEERLMKQQEELMRLQGERLAVEREEIERSQKMMRYALAIALLVIGTTLLIAFARARISADSKPPPVPPDSPADRT